MEITRKEFETYERVRASGVTNMWDTEKVSNLSGLDRGTILEIIKRYTALVKQYSGVRKEER